MQRRLDQGLQKGRQKQRNSGGTLRPELLRGIESRRLMGPAPDIYLNILKQALPSKRLQPFRP